MVVLCFCFSGQQKNIETHLSKQQALYDADHVEAEEAAVQSRLEAPSASNTNPTSPKSTHIIWTELICRPLFGLNMIVVVWNAGEDPGDPAWQVGEGGR